MLTRSFFLRYRVPLYGNALKRTLFIQTENTPNENAIKFKPGQAVTGESGIHEFLSRTAALRGSPLADSLLQVEGVKGVLLGSDFITINKEPAMRWDHLKPAIFATIMDHLTANKPILQKKNESIPIDEKVDHAEEDNEVVAMIEEILETRIRPAVQGDGGDVQLVAFRDGTVDLRLRGACRSCSSSTVTLKVGIENMLMHYIPEVKQVRQVDDPLEEQSQAYFDQIEKERSNK